MNAQLERRWLDAHDRALADLTARHAAHKAAVAKAGDRIDTFLSRRPVTPGPRREGETHITLSVSPVNQTRLAAPQTVAGREGEGFVSRLSPVLSELCHHFGPRTVLFELSVGLVLIAVCTVCAALGLAIV